jgi:oligopeptidase A
MQNPLLALDFSGLPRFDVFQPEHVTPAIDTLLAQNRALIARLEAPMAQVTWDNFVTPLEDANEMMGRAWGVVSHINSVLDSPALRAAYNENLPKLTEFWTEQAQNLALFDKYKTIKASPLFPDLTPAQQRIIDNAVRDFRLSGAELPPAEKARFAAIQDEAAALSTRFSENVLDATNDYTLLVEDEAQLAGLPPDAKQAARDAAAAAGKSGYQFSLHFPSFSPLLQFADERTLRETIYRVNATKASVLGTAYSECEKWDNSAIIVQLLKLRDEEAKLLGYNNFADVSMVAKMAQSPDQVLTFLADLARRARPFAEQDLAQLSSFAKAELDIAPLEAWDISYVSEKLRQQRYAFSAYEVKQYFPAPKVIEGMFKLVQTLFAVEIKPDTATAWHPDVQFFRIEREGRLLGQFYMDLYARSGKRGGAWMNSARSRRLLTGDHATPHTEPILQTPIAYLICNFTAPAVVDGVVKPALLAHHDVTTLFHEFGHSLHHMLTRVNERSVSGIYGVEWDAVELPSQFMENFCWEWDVLQHLTAHVDSGAPLPRALYDKMLAAKNFQSGLQTLRQMEMSLWDMHLHYDFDPSGSQTVQDVIDSVRKEFAVLTPPSYNRIQNSFSHIFAGGYAAGYYSYKWAEVLSADAYSAFEEAAEENGKQDGKQAGNILDRATGQRFEDEILAVGGSRPALTSFKAFRGREPKIDALLRRTGMAA